MLPFLKKSKESSASAPVESIERKPDEDKPYDALLVAAEDMISAFKADSPKDLAAAIRAAFELCDSEPHEEGPHS